MPPPCLGRSYSKNLMCWTSESSPYKSQPRRQCPNRGVSAATDESTRRNEPLARLNRGTRCYLALCLRGCVTRSLGLDDFETRDNAALTALAKSDAEPPGSWTVCRGG